MQKTKNFEIGMDASEVIERILARNPIIGHLKFRQYQPHAVLRERIKEEESNHFSVIELAIFPEMLQHCLISACALKRLSRNEILDEALQKKVMRSNFLNRPLAWAVCSDFDDQGTIFHLPMMDFDCGRYCGKERDDYFSITCFLEDIGQEGVLLHTGRGYHFYGFVPLMDSAWRNFVADCGLSGLVNPRYIYHLVKDGCASLRISTCSAKTSIPQIVALIPETKS